MKGFNSEDWQELRFDIDRSVNPDIVGTLTDMSAVETSSVDAIFSSHNIEHIYAHEVPTALSEFYRVLKPEGFAVIASPDLQAACEAVAQNRLLEPLYTSSAGPISAIDMLYGHRASLAAGNHFMAHKCGFTFSVLSDACIRAGFKATFGGRALVTFDLWLIAFKAMMGEEDMRRAATAYLP
ncbi:MAG TPA: methyltransferase domain-containing protein [Pseudolabrys sp.]|nr:methyltransferase domain-containing protein [Pseudolabrys sp.]